MPMAKPSGTSSPALTISLARKGKPTNWPRRSGSTPTYNSRAAEMSSSGSHIRLVSANHHRESMLPAPLESRSRNTTTVNA